MLDINKYIVSNEGFFDSFKSTSSSRDEEEKHHVKLTESEISTLTEQGKKFRQSFYRNKNLIYKTYQEYNEKYKDVEKLTEQMRHYGFDEKPSNLTKEDSKNYDKIYNDLIKIINLMIILAKKLNNVSINIFKDAGINWNDNFEIEHNKLVYFKINDDKLYDFDEILFGVEDLTDYPWRGLHTIDSKMEHKVTELMNIVDAHSNTPTYMLIYMLGI